MPNWNAGTLKVRGEKNNVISLLKEFAPFVDVYVDDKSRCISLFSNENTHVFHGVRRAMCQQKIEDEFWLEGDADEVIAVFECVEIAWALLPEHGWLELSQKHQVDFRWHGFERGMQYHQDIEICKGEVTRSQEITYPNYNWDCPFPNLGG